MPKEAPCCPFWIISTGSCTCSLDGLFIPPEDHAELFCNSREYQLCSQYARQNGPDTDARTTIHAERRTHERHTSAELVTVFKTEGSSDNLPSHFPALIVDYSMGGARVLTQQHLNKGDQVICSLGEQAPDQLKSTHAEIRWCLPMINNSGYQAGLFFTNGIHTISLSSQARNGLSNEPPSAG